ncbi:MAG: hypothetical protein GKR96_03905 [Gammaproteobacteria bacterium]|nr:hypothetical protein [Gammaproteobacteria bacterium]
MSFLTAHLKKVDESYFQHQKFALKFAWSMAAGSFACLVHAIFPFLCEKTGSSIIKDLHTQLVGNRGSDESEPNTEKLKEGYSEKD